MQSPTFVIDFTIDAAADPEAVRQAIESRLAAIAGVRVQTRREESRFTGAEMAEIGSIIAAGVIITKASRELIVELLKTVKEVVTEVRAVRAAVFDTGDERVALEDVTADKLQARAHE